jgi:hypothetical protein
MITRSMKIRRQLRSARVSALSEDERRAEMREADERRDDVEADPGKLPAGAAVPPRVGG